MFPYLKLVVVNSDGTRIKIVGSQIRFVIYNFS